VLKETNYNIQVQYFQVEMYKVISPPVLQQIAPESHNYTEQIDFLNMGYFSGVSDFSSTVASVANLGCSASDYPSTVNGSIALISRGNCTFLQKALLAMAANAKGALIYNDGTSPDRTGLFFGSIGGAVSIPVFALPFGLGEAFSEIPGLILHMAITAQQYNTTTSNVIADTTNGDPNLTIVLGSHLDSVPAGPGINDNGSGSATNLELALLFFKLGIIASNRLRFAWWGAEEIGLLGSSYYVTNLTPAEKNQIVLNINIDMIGSPNYFRGVYNGSSGSDDIRNGSTAVQGLFEGYFVDSEVPYDLTGFDGRSDYGPFIANGIPAGGLFTGAEVVKTPDMRKKYKGIANAAYDTCYHQACDTIDNINVDVLKEMAGAVAYALDFLAPMPDLQAFLDNEP